jgi:hypothetical protein
VCGTIQVGIEFRTVFVYGKNKNNNNIWINFIENNVINTQPSHQIFIA